MEFNSSSNDPINIYMSNDMKVQHMKKDQVETYKQRINSSFQCEKEDISETDSEDTIEESFPMIQEELDGDKIHERTMYVSVLKPLRLSWANTSRQDMNINVMKTMYPSVMKILNFQWTLDLENENSCFTMAMYPSVLKNLGFQGTEYMEHCGFEDASYRSPKRLLGYNTSPSKESISMYESVYKLMGFQSMKRIFIDGEEENMLVLRNDDYNTSNEDLDEFLHSSDTLIGEMNVGNGHYMNGDGSSVHVSKVKTIHNSTISSNYSVNELEVVTNREGRSHSGTGSLSKFIDDTDSFRRRSLHNAAETFSSSNGSFSVSFSKEASKQMKLSAFLDMGIDPILEILEDTDSEIRQWLLSPATVEEVIKEFIKPPILEETETNLCHEEYGFYKNYFICSEIIMKLYTGEDELYESFSSDSSQTSSTKDHDTNLGSTSTSVFGCQRTEDLQHWEMLYSIFLPRDGKIIRLDEMQLLFFSKALVRLHDGFCLEEGYVENVLKQYLPWVMPHFYSNTIKYMYTLMLQSYESVHPITGRNDAMEITVPLLGEATRVLPDTGSRRENWNQLILDMLQANQADRLGSFSRREGGIYLSKYFVRDQFGTIRGFESMTHGYHNFLQFMLLEELGKQTGNHELFDDESSNHLEDLTVFQLFNNAAVELETIMSTGVPASGIPSISTVQVATELLVLLEKYGHNVLHPKDNDDLESGDTTQSNHSDNLPYNMPDITSSANYPPYDQMNPDSQQSPADTAMYALSSLQYALSLWKSILFAARHYAARFCALFHTGSDGSPFGSPVGSPVGSPRLPLPSTVAIALAKHLHALVLLNDHQVNQEMSRANLMGLYLSVLIDRPTFDMLLIHVVPALSYILRDDDGLRNPMCPLTLDLFACDAGDDDRPSDVHKIPSDEEMERHRSFSHAKYGCLLTLLLKAKTDIPELSVYAGILHDVIDELFAMKPEHVTENNLTVRQKCIRSGCWYKLSETAEDDGSPIKFSGSHRDSWRSNHSSSSAKDRLSPQPEIIEEKMNESPVVETPQLKTVDELSAIQAEEIKQQQASKEAGLGNLNVKTSSSSTSPVKEKETKRKTSFGAKFSPGRTRKKATSDGDGSTSGSQDGYLNKLKNLQSQAIRLGTAIKEKIPERFDTDTSDSAESGPRRASRNSEPTRKSESESEPGRQRNSSFGWNSVFKRIRNSLASTNLNPVTSTAKRNSKFLQLGNHDHSLASPNSLEATLSPGGQNFAPRLTEVLIVDTSRGDDISNHVYHDGGVHVVDVGRHPYQNVLTSGYMYRSKFPETGQRHIWERFYFCLNRLDRSLSYYISEAHAKDRSFICGTCRPVSLTEGVPISIAKNTHQVCGFQIQTEGHGCFMVLVDSIDTRLTWITEITMCLTGNNSGANHGSRRSLHVEESLDSNSSLDVKSHSSWTRSDMKALVVQFYSHLYGPSLKFKNPLDAPPSFWMDSSNVPDIKDVLGETCVFSSNLPDSVPYWGEFHGFQQLCDYWKMREETVERCAGKVLRILVDEQEETATVMTSSTIRILRNSHMITEEACDIVSLSGGKIVSIHSSFDSHRVAQAFRKEGVSAS